MISQYVMMRFVKVWWVMLVMVMVMVWKRRIEIGLRLELVMGLRGERARAWGVRGGCGGRRSGVGFECVLTLFVCRCVREMACLRWSR